MSETFQPTLIVAGLVLCLFGWTLYWLGLRLLGLTLGGVSAAAVVGVVLSLSGVQQYLLLSVVGAAVVGALLGLFLIKRAHYFFFFVAGAVVGLAAARLVELTSEGWIHAHIPSPAGRVLYYAVCSVVCGCLVLLAHRIIVITVTAFAGAMLVALGVPSQYAVWLILPLFLGSWLLQMGILVALGEGEPEPEEEEAEEP